MDDQIEETLDEVNRISAVDHVSGQVIGHPQNDSFRLNKFLLKDKNIPKYIQKKMWAFSHKGNKLTNLTDNDIKQLQANFDIVKVRLQMSRPYRNSGKNRWDKRLNAHQEKMEFFTDCELMRTNVFLDHKRSKDMMERRLIAGSEQTRIFKTTDKPKKGGGLLGRLFGGKKEGT